MIFRLPIPGPANELIDDALAEWVDSWLMTLQHVQRVAHEINLEDLPIFPACKEGGSIYTTHIRNTLCLPRGSGVDKRWMIIDFLIEIISSRRIVKHEHLRSGINWTREHVATIQTRDWPDRTLVHCDSLLEHEIVPKHRLRVGSVWLLHGHIIIKKTWTFHFLKILY